MTAVPFSQLTWDGTRRTLYTDASDLGFGPGDTPVTVDVQSGRTGRVAHFHLTAAQRDSDGDIACWNLRPTALTATEIPEMADVRLCVVND